MGKRILSHLRANVYGLIAIFIALGGAAYAAGLPPGSVGTKQLKNSAVTNPKLADHAVTGAKVANKSLGGKQIKSATLGTVPNASHAASADAAAPTGPASGGLSGTYPSPGIAAGAVDRAQLAESSVAADKLGFRTRTDSSATNTDTPKSASAECPSGTTVISGGATTDNGYGTPAPRVALSSSGLGVFFNGWTARAFQTGQQTTWQLTVTAICIRK